MSEINVVQGTKAMLKAGPSKWYKGDFIDNDYMYDDDERPISDVGKCVMGWWGLTNENDIEDLFDIEDARKFAKIVLKLFPSRTNILPRSATTAPVNPDRLLTHGEDIANVIAYFNDNSYTSWNDIKKVAKRFLDEVDIENGAETTS